MYTVVLDGTKILHAFRGDFTLHTTFIFLPPAHRLNGLNHIAKLSYRRCRPLCPQLIYGYANLGRSLIVWDPQRLRSFIFSPQRDQFFFHQESSTSKSRFASVSTWSRRTPIPATPLPCSNDEQKISTSPPVSSAAR